MRVFTPKPPDLILSQLKPDMGCCCSKSKPNSVGRDSSCAYKIDLPDRHYLKKPIKQISVLTKMMDRLQTDLIIDQWQQRVVRPLASRNIFSGVLIKYPEVVGMFDFEDGFTQRLGRHLTHVHNTVTGCLSQIRRKAVNDLSVTLHNLGVFHAQKGVTVNHLLTFQATSIQFVNEQLKMPDKKASKVAQKQAEVIVSILQLIVEVMLIGLERYKNVMIYVKAVMDNKMSCWTKRKMRRKCHSGGAKRSWRKMELHLSKL